jgi:hypothetical protein
MNVLTFNRSNLKTSKKKLYRNFYQPFSSHKTSNKFFINYSRNNFFNKFVLFWSNKIKKFFIIITGVFGFYFLFKSKNIKKHLILDPIDDILNSKEVKGTGILLLEDLFKDKRTKINVLVALKTVIKEKQFEDEFKIFIKAWLFKVIKHPEFLKETKHTVIHIFKSPSVTSEVAVLLKFISDQDKTKQVVAQWMKDIFLGPSVFEDFCFLFERSSINSVKNEKTKSEVNVLFSNLIKDREFMSLIYMKALNILENSNNFQDNQIKEAI